MLALIHDSAKHITCSLCINVCVGGLSFIVISACHYLILFVCVCGIHPRIIICEWYLDLSTGIFSEIYRTCHVICAFSLSLFLVSLSFSYSPSPFSSFFLPLKS